MRSTTAEDAIAHGQQGNHTSQESPANGPDERRGSWPTWRTTKTWKSLIYRHSPWLLLVLAVLLEGGALGPHVLPPR